jgi:hypothetical protein
VVVFHSFCGEGVREGGMRGMWELGSAAVDPLEGGFEFRWTS